MAPNNGTSLAPVPTIPTVSPAPTVSQAPISNSTPSPIFNPTDPVAAAARDSGNGLEWWVWLLIAIGGAVLLLCIFTILTGRGGRGERGSPNPSKRFSRNRLGDVSGSIDFANRQRQNTDPEDPYEPPPSTQTFNVDTFRSSTGSGDLLPASDQLRSSDPLAITDPLSTGAFVNNEIEEENTDQIEEEEVTDVVELEEYDDDGESYTEESDDEGFIIENDDDDYGEEGGEVFGDEQDVSYYEDETYGESAGSDWNDRANYGGGRY